MQQDVNAKDFIMLPKVDLIFKELMAHEKIRRGFLSAVLKIKKSDIKKTILVNTNMRVMHEKEKLCILDVRVIMNDNTEIDIEIQISYYGTWAERATFYLARMLTEQTGVNKTYSNVKKCIGISILNFRYTADDRFYKCYHLREDDSNEKLTDILELHIIELPKLPLESDGSALYNWVKFIKAESKEELEMAARTDTSIKEAYKYLKVISQDKQKQVEYTSRLKALMDYNTIIQERYELGKSEGIEIGEKRGMEIGEKKGRAEGIEIGEKRGRAEGRQELIEQLLKSGMPESELKKYLS